MEGFINDELKIYRGEDYAVKDKIIVHQPTLGEICDFGEQAYWQMVYTLTSVPADLKWQLAEAKKDYTTIDDFQLFYEFLSRICPQNRTSILLGDLDLSKMVVLKDNETEQIFMYDIDNDIKIDECTYLVMMDVIRKMHNLKRNDQMPGNETTKQILIEDAKEEYLLNKDKEFRSQLKNLISAMINSEGFKYNHSEVWNMKINAFMDSVKRIGKIKNADLLLQSGYSGFGVNLKGKDKEINWLGELD